MSRNAKVLALVLTIILVLVGLLAWRRYGPGRNVYAVDVPIEGAPSDCAGEVRLAVIGDFGHAGQPEADVAALVDRWGVDFIVTVGDNNYVNGTARTIDRNIGQYYQAYIHPYKGDYGPGAAENRFFPALGNHDWSRGSIEPYLDYFTLPGNERYYDLHRGPVQIFVLDSNAEEPDGRTADSLQAQWLQGAMGASTAPWQLVALHHAPYSSGTEHGDDPVMQWPYAEWGADAVLAGHEHNYEHLQQDGILYFVNGLGGRRKIHLFGEARPGSTVRYNRDYGAMLITADAGCLNFTFYNRAGELIDSVTLTQAVEG